MSLPLNRRTLAALALGLLVPAFAARAQEAPEALILRISTDVIEAAKADKAIQAGDVQRIIVLVYAKVMPSVNFEVMTRSAVGPLKVKKPKVVAKLLEHANSKRTTSDFVTRYR